jgi:uncharacterized protein YdeI (YjbR/CyaY-like superfamily)
METLPFPDKRAFEDWLDANHATAPGVWLQFAKKGSGVPTITYAEAVEVALCYGWIDGQAKSVDESFYLQRFTPRRARSRWSQINVEKAKALIERGAMRPAGLAEVERAKADGRWDAAYASPSRMTVPDDLQAELDKDPAAAEFFASLDSQNRYAILYRLHDAKRAETRARRLARFMELLRRRETLH